MEKPSEQEEHSNVIELRKRSSRVAKLLKEKCRGSLDERRKSFWEIHDYIRFGTKLEVEGKLSQEFIEDVGSLRKELKILAKNLKMLESISPEDWILVGIVDKKTVPDDKFQQCLREHQDDEDFKQIVSHFLGEREKNNQ